MMMRNSIWCLLLLSASSVVGYHQIGRRDLLEGKVEVLDVDEEPLFLRPRHLEPGELATVVRRDNGERVDRGALFIGLPKDLTESFQAYVKESGLMDLAYELLYKNPVQEDERRIYPMTDGTKWGVRTSNNWVDQGDMTWIDPADEYTYERVLDIYRKAGFDTVLDTIGEKYGNHGLWVDGTSFIIVSHHSGDNVHTDLEGQEGYVFNVLFPIVIPSTGGVLELSGRETFQPLGANFRYHQGVLVGGETPHGTGNVDYRPTQEFRMAIAVYIDDYNEETVEEFDDDTASYPPGSDYDFMLAQQARHWSATDSSSLVNDKGRKPVNVMDEYPPTCLKWEQEGKCMQSLEVRNECQKTCKVYMENDLYYENLGKLMDWPTESNEK